MGRNITNIISIVVNALPAPLPPTSATQSSPSPSASGTSQSIGQQLVAAPGFGVLIIIVVGCLTDSGYFLWRKPASKDDDLENTPPKDVTMGEQPKETRDEIPAGYNVEARPLPVTPAPSITPKKKRLSSAKLANLGTITRTTAHGMKEGLAIPPETASLVC